MTNQDDNLLNQLIQLNESQIEQLIYRLRVGREHLRLSGVTPNQTALDLIRYLEPQDNGLERLRRALEKLLTPFDLEDPTSLPVCPYLGLSAFQEKDADFFFGREAFIDDWVEEDGSIRQGLLRAVETKPLVAVIGASGSGKSSLVFAGLLPRLRRTGDWLIESCRPEKQPFFTLANALMHQLEPELDRIDLTAKAHDLAETIQKYGIAGVVSQILKHQSGKRLLLVVDQFEELYTQCAAEERNRFIDVLLEGISKSVGLKIVLTLRADFCGQAYDYRPLADALQGADLKLGPMNRGELQQAIERPSQLMQVEFEDGLTDWLLDDVGEEAGNLPLLEFALTELWKMQRQKTLIYEAYVRLGGVARALANHADNVYASLSPENQKRAQQIFVQLVRPGDGTEDTRRVASRSEVGDDNWDLVTYLAGEEARLIVTGRAKETVEIVHEALLREWQQLRKWMEQDRDFRVWQEELRSAYRRWQQSGQDKTALLDGFFLSEAEEWQSNRYEDLSTKDQEFIQLGLEERNQRQREEEKRLKKELKQARRTTIAAMTGGGLLLTLSIAAINFAVQAEHRKHTAIEALISTSRSLLETNNQLEALIASVKAIKQLDSIGGQNKRAVDELNSIISEIYERNRLEGHEGPVNSISFNRNGQTIASASGDTTVRVWKNNGELITTLSGHEDIVWKVAFNPADDMMLASASEDSSVRIWSLSGKPEKILNHSEPVFSLRFNTDGSRLVTLSGKTISFWDVSSGLLLKSFEDQDFVQDAEFSHNGKVLASTGYFDGNIKLWNIETGQASILIRNRIMRDPDNQYTNIVSSVEFNPKYPILAASSYDGTISLWNVQSNKLIQIIDAHENYIFDVSFSLDGNVIASASRDKTVKLWNLKGDLLKTLKGHDFDVNGASFSPDTTKGIILASASDDRTVRFWEKDLGASEKMSVANLLEKACEDLKNYLEVHRDLLLEDSHVCSNVNP
jgi:WD40 repeat protein